MIKIRSKNSKYISVTIGVVVALLSMWQVSGRTFEAGTRLKKAAQKAVLVPALCSTSVTAISMYFSQYFMNQ